MAELEALQGYDLYGVEKRGRSVFTAFEFLLNGIEKPSIVPGGKLQKVTFLDNSTHGDKVTAWFESLVERGQIMDSASEWQH